jgi:hypothetical protein
MLQARGCEAGNSASAELVHQRTQRGHAAQDHLAALADDGGRVRLAAVQMAADALGREGDRGQRILDLVGHALRHFLPGQLPLRAQQIRGVLDHQHGSRLAMSQLKARAGDGQMQDAASDMKLHLREGRSHAAAAAHDVSHIRGRVGGKQRFDLFPSQPIIL